MTFFAILIIAVALSLDAFAVAVASGVKLGTVNARQRFRMTFTFGLFQGTMPILGWFLGLTVRGFIEHWDHWAAFALLTLLGLNMIRESRSHDEDDQKNNSNDPTRGLSLILLAIATSIDALAVGLSFAFLKMSIWYPAAVIGVVCAAFTLAGLFLGRTLARAAVFGQRASLVGGLTLIAIGLKILYEHGIAG